MLNLQNQPKPGWIDTPCNKVTFCWIERERTNSRKVSQVWQPISLKRTSTRVLPRHVHAAGGMKDGSASRARRCTAPKLPVAIGNRVPFLVAHVPPFAKETKCILPAVRNQKGQPAPTRRKTATTGGLDVASKQSNPKTRIEFPPQPLPIQP